MGGHHVPSPTRDAWNKLKLEILREHGGLDLSYLDQKLKFYEVLLEYGLQPRGKRKFSEEGDTQHRSSTG